MLSSILVIITMIFFFFFFCIFHLVSTHQVFNLPVLRHCASSNYTLLSHSFFITSLHLSFGLPIFRCSPTSIFHVRITTSSSVFLSTCPNHISLAYLMFSHEFATPALVLVCFIPFLQSLNPLHSRHPSEHSHSCYV